MSGVPKWQRKGGGVPAKKTASDKKIETHQENLAAEQEFMQPVSSPWCKSRFASKNI
jgi:hypothetical protein